ncbi:MAG: hypothetical protein AB1758_18505, partial [Candidatus Eremiobacterota bacterium]
MSQIDRVLTQLLQDGKRDSRGFFTIDFRKAREKLQKFQLTDPHLYVAHVVASAVAGGATRVDVYVDADDCILTYDGATGTTAELEELFSHLLTTQGSARFRELAIALNAALALRPQKVEFLTWDGRQGARVDLSASHMRVSALDASPGFEGNRLHVRERISWKVVGKFLGKHVGRTPEFQILTERCAYAPIVLNRKRLTRDIRLMGALVVHSCGLECETDAPVARSGEGDFQAVLGLLTDQFGDRPGLRLEVLQHRVAGNPVEDTAYPYVVRGVLDHPGLAKNVSQSDWVHDERYKAMMICVRARVRDMLAELAEAYPELSGSQQERAMLLLRSACAHEVRAAEYSPRWHRLKQSLIDAPIWPDHQGQATPLRPFLEQYRVTGRLPVTWTRWEVSLPNARVLLLDPESDLVGKMFPRMENADDLL